MLITVVVLLFDWIFDCAKISAKYKFTHPHKETINAILETKLAQYHSNIIYLSFISHAIIGYKTSKEQDANFPFHIFMSNPSQVEDYKKLFTNYPPTPLLHGSKKDAENAAMRAADSTVLNHWYKLWVLDPSYKYIDIDFDRTCIILFLVGLCGNFSHSQVELVKIYVVCITNFFL